MIDSKRRRLEWLRLAVIWGHAEGRYESGAIDDTPKLDFGQDGGYK